ncbi:hypothetical protein EMCRGX_G026560 [Ephydatia muelleri]
MNGNFAWPSVTVYRDGTFSRRSIIKCDTDENFGALMERLEVNLGSETVTISAVADDKSVHSAHTVPLDAPVTLLETYGCHYVKFYLATSSSTISQAQQQLPNALEMLMQNAERLVLPPAAIYDSSSDSDQHIRGDYRLHNDFIHYLETKKMAKAKLAEAQDSLAALEEAVMYVVVCMAYGEDSPVRISLSGMPWTGGSLR